MASRQQKTTCKRGHPRTPENIRNNSAGYITCRVCERASKAAAAALNKKPIREAQHSPNGRRLNPI